MAALMTGRTVVKYTINAPQAARAGGGHDRTCSRSPTCCSCSNSATHISAAVKLYYIRVFGRFCSVRFGSVRFGSVHECVSIECTRAKRAQ